MEYNEREEDLKSMAVFRKYHVLFDASDVDGIKAYTLEFINNLDTTSDLVIITVLTACLPHCFQERTDLFNKFKEKYLKYSDSTEDRFKRLIHGLEPDKYNVTDNLNDVPIINKMFPR